MRRYRFGRLAALIAICYVAATVVFSVIALISGHASLLITIVAHTPMESSPDLAWWQILLLLLFGAGQGWLLWQVLRGRITGAQVAPDRTVRLLRGVLYFNAACSLISLPSFSLPLWWHIIRAVAGLALVLLFFLVLRHTSTALRVSMLVIGVLSEVTWIGAEIANELAATTVMQIFSFAWLQGLHWAVWMILIFVAQARDGRWGRTTVWAGATSVASTYFIMPFTFGDSSQDFFYDGPTAFTMVLGVYGVTDLLLVAWKARSAHDLASPPARPEAGTARPLPLRRPLGWWPPAVIAIVLPLIPATVNLVPGLPMWVGPRGAIESFLSINADRSGLLMLWLVSDILIGVGGPAILVLFAVVRRTIRLVRVTATILFAAAGVGIITALTTEPDPVNEPWAATQHEEFLFPDIYPDWMFAPDSFGISPLWFSAAFAASALLLIFRYGGGPAHRTRLHVLASVAAATVVLCFLPTGDLATGKVITEDSCLAPMTFPGEYREPLKLTGERAFVCGLIGSEALPAMKGAPDRVAGNYGRTLCGVFTRNDPEELARVERVDGIKVRDLTATLDPICPSAAAIAATEQAREEAKMRAWEAAEQRVCDEAPRHRPRIKPASAIRQREPVYTDYGDLEAYEPEVAEGNPNSDLPHNNDVLSVGPGHLRIHTYPDLPLCVTTETYTRRPPVETKGWQHVVEVGHQSLSGEIILTDSLSGATLPNLAVRGKGDYRIRVHYSWIGKGQERKGQRLLIMAYPGLGSMVPAVLS